nr:retrovirus-related Pol polyprotein from transposon TNT 1-94 [Tanacetum cinerariifolium]
MAAIDDVPQLVNKKGEGGRSRPTPWTSDERRVVVQDQRLKSIIMSCLPDDIMESVIRCVLAKERWNDLVHSFEDYKAEYKKMKAKLALLEEEVSDDEEVTRVKILMTLADDELTVGKIMPVMCRDELLVLKQAKLDAITFQIQNTELTKLNYALQEQLKEDKNINEKCLTSSIKVSQCISEQIPHQKKKVLGGESLTESSKMNKSENLFIPAFIGYDQEMVPKTKDWVERLNPDSKLLNFNTKRILVPKSQAVNKSLKPTEMILYCMICKREDHRTSDHEMYTASLKRSENYKTQPYQYASSSKQIMKAKAKPFSPCTHCGFNDHRPDDCRNYTKCEICGSYDHVTSGHNRVIHIRGGIPAESSQSNESSIGVKCNTCKSTIHSTTDHNDFDHFKRGYYFVSKAFRVFNTRRQKVEKTYHVAFDESMEAIRFTNTSVEEIGIDDSSRYPPDEFLQKDDPSRQYQVDSDISYYIIPYGRSLTELTQENHVPELIVPTEPNIPHTKDTEECLQEAATSASECLFADFLYEIELKNVSEEEGIVYDETFVPVARIESIRIFLAFVTYMNFKVYQMDVKSTFLSGKLKEEVYVKQPLGFESSFNLKGYLDSDYAGCNMDMKSTSAEYVAVARCCASILWMKSQLSDYTCITRWDHILKGDIELHFIPTEYQLADIFTKPLDEPTFTRLKAQAC